MPLYTVDRFEDGDFAVLEDEQARTFSVPRHWLPSTAREGDVLTVSETVSDTSHRIVRFELEPAARDERLTNARRLRDGLPRGPKGDISL